MTVESDEIESCSVEKLPTEILRKIFYDLDETASVNGALVCSKWYNILSPSIDINELDLTLNYSCANSSKVNRCVFSLNMCVCFHHLSESCITIRQILTLKEFQNIKRFCLEDENALTKVCHKISPIETIIRHLNKNVKVMELVNIDMSAFNVLTFFQLGQFCNISTLILTDCVFPNQVDNNLFVTTLAPMLPLVENLEITGTSFINDDFGIALAKHATALATVNLQRCKNITATTIASFCTQVGSSQRSKHVTFHLYSTSFDANTLNCYLHLLEKMDDKRWELNLVDLRETTNRLTIVISNREEHGYTIFY